MSTDLDCMDGGRPEKKLPPGVKPHRCAVCPRFERSSAACVRRRCNPHLDALLDGIFAGPAHIAKPARVFYQCLKSEPGR